MRSQRQATCGYSRHVLVMDRDTQLLDVLRKRLEMEGYRVTTSSMDWGVELAIAVLRPEVVLLDPLMSDVVWEGLPELLRAYPAGGAVPIVLHSSVPEGIASTSRFEGALGVIRKTTDDLEFAFAFNGLMDRGAEPVAKTSVQPLAASRRSGTHAIDVADETAVVAIERSGRS